MANVRKRISELNPLTSASLDTTIVGVDNGTTYKIELDTLADAVTARVNTLDRDRLSSLESVTSSFETKGRSILSGSISYTSLTNIPQGIVSQSTDLSSLNTFTSSYYTDSASFSNRIDAATNEQDLSYFAITGSNNFVGNQNITGSLIVTGSNIELKRDWPAVGTESHFLRLAPFTSSTNRYYDGLSVGIEHWDDGTGTYEHSLLIHSFDDDVNQNYGAELNVGPYRTHMRVYPSGSNGSLSNISVQELSNGKTQALVYGDYVQIGAFVSQDILIGNTGSLIAITGSNMLLDTPLTSSEAIVASLFSGSVSGIGNVTTFSSSIDSRLDSLENATGSYLTSLNGAISSSSQLTSSYDTRYVISGSITQTTWDNIASKPSDIVSGSSQLTSSYDLRYTLSGSVQPLPSNLVSSSAQITAFGFISSSTTINTSSFATTGSNSFNGNQTITGSLIVSAVAVVNGGVTIPTASVITLTSGSSISVDASGAITGSLTGSVFGIGDVVAFSASVNSRILSGSAVAGTISSSAQISGLGYATTSSLNSFTSSYNADSSSFNSRFNGLVTTGSNTFSGSQVFSGSMTVTSGQVVASLITANTSSLYLTSGSNLYLQNNGVVEITGSLIVSGTARFTTVGGDEGGEIEFGVPQTNTSLTSSVKVDIFQNRLRIFDGNTNGVFIDLSKAPTGVAGEITWKSSGIVNAGTFVQLDNIKATCTTSGSRGLSLATVSGTFNYNIGGNFAGAGVGSNGTSLAAQTLTTTPTTSIFGWGFIAQGETSTYILTDITNNRAYRITLQIGGSFNNNFIAIERLH